MDGVRRSGRNATKRPLLPTTRTRRLPAKYREDEYEVDVSSSSRSPERKVPTTATTKCRDEGKGISPHCQLCGQEGGSVNKSNNAKTSSRIFQKQWTVFKLLIRHRKNKGSKPESSSSPPPQGLCDSCSDSIRQVWELHLEIEDIQKEINVVLDKVLKANDVAKGKSTPIKNNNRATTTKDDELEELGVIIPSRRKITKLETIDVDDLGSISINLDAHLAPPSPPPPATTASFILVDDSASGDEDIEHVFPFTPPPPSSIAEDNVDEVVIAAAATAADGGDSSDFDMDLEPLPPQFGCSVCGKKFVRARNRASHEINWCHVPYDEEKLKEEGVRLFRCLEEGCNGICFTSDDHFKKHTASKHFHKLAEDQRTLLACSACGKPFSRVHARLAHEINLCKIPRSDEELKALDVVLHKCPETSCGWVFQFNKDLQRHVRTHTGNKPFICSLCGRGFRQESSRQNHERLVCYRDKGFADKLAARSAIGREKLKASTIVCPMDRCGHKFLSERKLQVHLDKFHAQDPAQTVICDTCGKVCTRAQLSYHQSQAHERSTSNFYCNKLSCGEKFPSLKAMRKHLVSAHGSDPRNFRTGGKKKKSSESATIVTTTQQELSFS